jgi:hypothetical protein
MKSYISNAFREPKEIIEIVNAADDLGYDGVASGSRINLRRWPRRIPTPHGEPR